MGIKFNGIPEKNETFEIPDNKSKRAKNKNLNRDVEDALRGIRDLQKMSPEEFRKMLPGDVINELEREAKNIGLDFNTLFTSAVESSTKAIEQMLNDDALSSGILNIIRSGQIPLDLSVFKTGILPDDDDLDDFISDKYPGLNLFDILAETSLEEDDIDDIVENVEDLDDLQDAINFFYEEKGLTPPTIDELSQQAYSEQKNNQSNSKNNIASFVQSIVNTESTKEPAHFENGNIDYLLDPEKFGSVLYKRTPDLLEKFIETGIKNWDDFPKNTIIYSNENSPMDLVNEMKLVDSSDKYLLYYVKPRDNQAEGTLGLYIAVFMNPRNEFEVLIPEFGNTYDDSELFNITKTPELFTQRGEFRLFDIEKINGELEVVLAEDNHPILNAKGFGEIIQQIVSPKSNNHLLKVGMIKSNESTEAVLLKKDGELNLEETSYPFIINFGEIVDSDVLGLVSHWLSKVDLNNCPLMDTLNLRTKHGEFIYVDMDLGIVLENIKRWYGEEGNSI